MLLMVTTNETLATPHTPYTTEKMVSPFFSIIIPVYNVAPYLRECLDSILAQSFSDWECICVDDGATDGAGQILDEYAQKDKRIHVIHQRNRGVSAARNRALTYACGEFICFADGDDIAYPWWLSTFAHFQRLSQADLVRTQFPHYLPYCEVTPNLNKVPTQLFEGPQAVLEWGWESFCRDGYPFLYAVRRTCITTTRFLTNVRLKEDILFDLTFLPQIHRALQCDVISYWYRCRANSAVKRRAPHEETCTRILHYTHVYAAQKEDLIAAHANVQRAASWVILRDLVTLVIDRGARRLPEMLQVCCEQGALTLSTLPKRWKVLLGLALRGCLWPICIYSYLSFCKWEIIGWWKQR